MWNRCCVSRHGSAWPASAAAASPVPPREADAWIAFAESHGQYGELVPISPLIGELTAASAGIADAGTNPIVSIKFETEAPNPGR